MKKILTLLLALAFGSVALAQSTGTNVNKAVGQQATLSWTAPTTNTDGSAISGALTYNVYSCPAGTVAGSAASACTQVAMGLATTTYTTAAFTVAGTFNYAVTAVETPSGASGMESALSNLVTALVTAPVPPNPPAGVTIQ